MIRRSQQDSGRVQGLSCWRGVDRKLEDPEISRFKKNTNFLRGRTFCQDPRIPKKVVQTPGFPKKVVRNPRFPGIGRFPGFWGSGPPETGDSRGDGPDSPETAVFPGSGGGSEKVKAAPRHPDCSRKRPITTYATPMGFVPFCPWGGSRVRGCHTQIYNSAPNKTQEGFNWRGVSGWDCNLLPV